ncbi:hypothetical protein Pmar_PMAR000547, partial [Perkinsus marinus ATCC 50983]
FLMVQVLRLCQHRHRMMSRFAIDTVCSSTVHRVTACGGSLLLFAIPEVNHVVMLRFAWPQSLVLRPMIWLETNTVDHHQPATLIVKISTTSQAIASTGRTLRFASAATSHVVLQSATPR